MNHPSLSPTFDRNDYARFMQEHDSIQATNEAMFDHSDYLLAKARAAMAPKPAAPARPIRSTAVKSKPAAFYEKQFHTAMQHPLTEEEEEEEEEDTRRSRGVHPKQASTATSRRAVRLCAVKSKPTPAVDSTTEESSQEEEEEEEIPTPQITVNIHTCVDSEQSDYRVAKQRRYTDDLVDVTKQLIVAYNELLDRVDSVTGYRTRSDNEFYFENLTLNDKKRKAYELLTKFEK